MYPIQIIHTSDWHLRNPPRYPWHYWGKRLLAYSYSWWSSKRQFDDKPLKALLEHMTTLSPGFLVISGDLSTTGREEEIEDARRWLAQAPPTIQPIIVPGNHDVYEDRTPQTPIYRLMADTMGGEVTNTLYQERIASYHKGDLRFILLDQSAPRPWGDARGLFSSAMKERLIQILDTPTDAKHTILVGHYPLQSLAYTSQELVGREALITAIKDRPVIYLHGHTHCQHCIDERLPYQQPLSCDAGSLGLTTSSSYTMLELHPNHLLIDMRHYGSDNRWTSVQRLITALKP